MMKINNYKDDQTDVSAVTKSLVQRRQEQKPPVVISVAGLAEISLTSPRKLLIFIIK